MDFLFLKTFLYGIFVIMDFFITYPLTLYILELSAQMRPIIWRKWCITYHMRPITLHMWPITKHMRPIT